MATNKNDLNSYENLVFGLGETGMSIARYFNRKKINAISRAASVKQHHSKGAAGNAFVNSTSYKNVKDLYNHA